MIQITFKIDQLKINQTQSVNLNHQIVSEIRKILYNSGIDLSDWEKIQCQVTYNNNAQEYTKTFQQAGVTNGANLFIKFSRLITIQILNKEFQNLEINVDAFDSIQKFKTFMIQNHLKNIDSKIVINNGVDGKQIEKDTWIQNAKGNSIQVLLNISTKQSILWKGEEVELNFDVFYPISKVIQNFKNKLNINDIIQLQCQDAHLKPELTYFHHNLPLNVLWNASVPNELIYRVLFEKQSREKLIICAKDQVINDKIKQLRLDFNIHKDNKITLMYQWALDESSTFAQEGIPNYSLLKLVEEEYKGEFQIYLQNINENTQLNQSQYVNNQTSLEELSKKILHQQKSQEVHFFLESQTANKLNAKQKMQDLNIQNGATIKYKIVQRIKQKKDDEQIEYIKFNVLVININIIIYIEICNQNKFHAFTEIIQYKLGLPKNQIMRFSIGTKLLKGDENINEIMDGKFKFLQVLLLTTLNINFKNKNTEANSLITVNLEDTLRKVSERLKIQATFQLNNQYLGIDETFAQLKIFDGDTIIFDLTSTPKEGGEISVTVPVQNIKQNNVLHQASPFNSHSIENDNQQQQGKLAQTYDQFQANQPINNFNNAQITVNATVGEKIYKFNINGNENFESLKQVIFNLAIQGYEQQNIKQYNLMYGDQVLRDEQNVSSLNRQEIHLQFKLK